MIIHNAILNLTNIGVQCITAIQALIQITEIYLDAKAVLCKVKATSEDAYLQETMHVSNHTLAWTVSTEIYCTLKLDVLLKSKKRGEMVNEDMAVLPKQEDVSVIGDDI